MTAPSPAASGAGTAFADPGDVRLAVGAAGLLGAFNAAGVLNAADVHVARRLGRFVGESDEAVLLAVALAVRAPRLGHVLVDLETVRRTATVDVDNPVDLQTLPWPEPGPWVAGLAASPLVATGLDGPGDRPLRLVGSWVYLDRYWREERQVAADLAARAGQPMAGVDTAVLDAGLDRLFPPAPPSGVPDPSDGSVRNTGTAAGPGDGAVGQVGSATVAGDGDGGPDRQRLAAETAVRRALTVVAGGPGTGKTTTVARILALLDEQASAAGRPPPLVALAAPTGKAAARLEEAVHEEAAGLPVDERRRQRLLATHASTIHRLLGWQPGNRSRFRHHRGNRLPHDVVIVDETSMVSLSQMAKLVEAVRPDARLVLVGDPQQLASVEAGAVLGDIVGPAADGAVGPSGGDDTNSGAGTGAGDRGVAAGIVVLRRVHRFGGGIAAVADAVRRGDTDATIAVLSAGHDDVVWIAADVAGPDGAGRRAAGSDAATGAGAGGAGRQAAGSGGGDLSAVREVAVRAGAAIAAAARAGDARGALDALGGFRLLCAHRRGPYGVGPWSARVEGWLGAAVPGFAATGAWYVGRPLLVTENDYTLGLYNGDTGVVVAGAGGRPVAVFERRGQILEFSPARLSAVETVHVMTIHKSQGSQFDTVAALLPDPDSPILTRELLYTAVTRARRRLLLAGTEEAVRAAVSRPAARSSGLRRWLWSPDQPGATSSTSKPSASSR
ncbi:MAG TPA: exodeoxyribonuclease V subunit alpha [Acidimicrobiia bacterium]|nr:exodeoxyribonuclease V subunit alpha [Acidimicrobiia bacterium]